MSFFFQNNPLFGDSQEGGKLLSGSPVFGGELIIMNGSESGIIYDGTITPLGAALEFDPDNGQYNSSFLIDPTHVMCFWTSGGSDGYCQIFEINTSTGAVTPLGVALEFDVIIGTFNSAILIDSTHVMNFWRGVGNDGFCQIFEIDTVTGVITPLGAALEFDNLDNIYNSALLIDSTHVMCFWSGVAADGYCQIFEINTGTGVVTPLDVALEFDAINGSYNSALLIDSTHVMCFWSGDGADGYCQIFEINTGTGVVTPLDVALEFDVINGSYNSALLIDSTHVMCFWSGDGSDGYCQIFEINTGTGVVTPLDVALEFDEIQGTHNSSFLIDDTHVMCFWSGDGSDGYCQIFEIDTITGVITPLGAAFEFDETLGQHNSALLIDSTHVMNFWAGLDNDGFAQIFEIS
jgi:hypothetical protein